MDESSAEEIDYIISNLMVFYKGALSYETLQNMPLPEIYQLNLHAGRISKEIEKASKK